MILIAVLTVLRVDGAEAGGNGRHQHRQGQQQRRRRRDTPPRGLLHPAANHADGGRRDARWSTLFSSVCDDSSFLSLSLYLYLYLSLSVVETGKARKRRTRAVSRRTQLVLKATRSSPRDRAAL